MNTLVGVECLYVLESTVEETATAATTTALETFDTMATMGRRSHINHFRERLVMDLDEERARYVAGALNITMWIGCLRDKHWVLECCL